MRLPFAFSTTTSHVLAPDCEERVDAAYHAPMDRPGRFEHNRFLGDKRTQVVYDLDSDDVDQEVVDELMQAESYLSFAPDTLAEARNRGYHAPRGG